MQYKTVLELLHRFEEATQAVGQTYTINTFDLGVCMKALLLVWRRPDKYQKHIIVPVPFHTEMNYIGTLTDHKAQGSGYADILLTSGLAEKGCLKHVLSGKAFAKAIFYFKVMLKLWNIFCLMCSWNKQILKFVLKLFLTRLQHAIGKARI